MKRTGCKKVRVGRTTLSEGDLSGWRMLRTTRTDSLAGIAYLVWHILSKGSPGTIDETAGLSGWIEFRRRELVRQRDLLRSIWKWYIGPCVPGLAVLVVWLAFGNRSRPVVVLMAALYVLAVATGFWWMGRLNAKGAEKLQRQIDELDEQSRDEG